MEEKIVKQYEKNVLVTLEMQKCFCSDKKHHRKCTRCLGIDAFKRLIKRWRMGVTTKAQLVAVMDELTKAKTESITKYQDIKQQLRVALGLVGDASTTEMTIHDLIDMVSLCNQNRKTATATCDDLRQRLAHQEEVGLRLAAQTSAAEKRADTLLRINALQEELHKQFFILSGLTKTTIRN